MIKLGLNSIRAIYRGNVEVVKAYLGDTVLFDNTVIYNVSVSIHPDGGGTVTGAGQYKKGAHVVVKANPSDGYAFSSWINVLTEEVLSTAEEYSFVVDRDIELLATFAATLMEPLDFPYTGEPVTVTLGPGLYVLETWGAQGGYRNSSTYAGKGGYSIGMLELVEDTDLIIRVGGSGNTGGKNGGFNGGGKRSDYPGGGGATDIRIEVDDIYHRVIVAGGGGSDGGSSKPGKYGGGLTGGDVGTSGSANGYGTAGYGGTQTGNSGGTSWIADSQSATTTNDADAKSGFGFGGNGINKNKGFGGAGGGGWYGGTGRIPDSSGDDDGGGAGGSGFVWTGENAPENFGLSEKHHLRGARTVDGSQSFVSPDGGTESGHSGDGYARISPPSKYTITLIADGPGTVSGGGVYTVTTKVDITATPNGGCKFLGWYENEDIFSKSNKLVFEVDTDRTFTAKFIDASSRLPEGYKEVEYISNPNLGYVSSVPPGKYSFYDCRIELDIDILDDNIDGTYIWGGYYYNKYNSSTTSSCHCLLQFLKNSTIGLGSGTYTTVAANPSLITLPYRSGFAHIVVDFPKKHFSINKDVARITASQSAMYRTEYSMFACNYSYTVPSVSSSQYIDGKSPSNFKLYGLRIYESSASDIGEVKYEYVPCISPDGVVGLYELVSGTFSSSYKDSLPLEAGPII